MTSFLIVLALLALAVGIVVWATRRKPARPYEQRLEQDTAWNDPVTPADAAPADIDNAVAPDPFAGAPSRPDSHGQEPRP